MKLRITDQFQLFELSQNFWKSSMNYINKFSREAQHIS